MLARKHSPFVGCDRQSAVVEAMMPGVFLAYTTQFLNDDSNIIASDEVLSA